MKLLKGGQGRSESDLSASCLAFGAAVVGAALLLAGCLLAGCQSRPAPEREVEQGLRKLNTM